MFGAVVGQIASYFEIWSQTVDHDHFREATVCLLMNVNNKSLS